MRKISATKIITNNGDPIQRGTIILNDQGEIEAVLSKEEFLEDAEQYDGCIVPGFINAHCHIELSHLKSAIPKHTGLVDFLLQVQGLRNFPEEEISAAMKAAEKEMLTKGIVAVGDISNTSHSFALKRKSKLYFHTFIELIGFNPEHADSTLGFGLALQKELDGLAGNVSPHAPYSVSDKLFQNIAEHAKKISIHNQETIDEDLFLKKKEGNFNRLYQQFGINIDFFKAKNKSSLQSYLPHFNQHQLLLVHNTYSSLEDIRTAQAGSNEVFWCLCPAANLYIENSLPDVDLLMREDCQICIGTDSLASNHSLDILEEIRIIEKYFPRIPFETLIAWSSLNAAKFLGIDEKYGSIAAGKQPGLNLISPEGRLEVLA